LNGGQKMIIPHFGLARQYVNLKDELLEATDLAMRTGVLMDGEFTAEFEKWLTDYTGCEYATVVHSGTHALEFIAMHIANDEALANDNFDPIIRVPNITYPATLNAFLNIGWKVEIVDTDKSGIIIGHEENMPSSTYNCYVGLYGATGKNLRYHPNNTIVDGAQHWLSAGNNIGLGMAISFDPTKNLPSSGNGGAVVTNDRILYDSIVSAKNNGKPDYFDPGTNSRMSELECAHMLVRTRYIDEWQIARATIRKCYLKEFADLPIRCLSGDFTLHADQKFVIHTDQRDALRAYLIEQGIDARIHYPYTLSELPISKHANVISKPDLISTSVHLVRGLLSLPIYPEMTDSELEYVISKVREFYDKSN
jgi:dTDP-4-amino-4,6-dideoxygalactose transaminase